MQSANHTYIAALEYHKISDSLVVVIDSCQSVFRLYDSSINNLKTEISLGEQSIQERDVVIAAFEDTDKQNKKEISKLKKFKPIAIISSTAFIVVITCLILL